MGELIDLAAERILRRPPPFKPGGMIGMPVIADPSMPTGTIAVVAPDGITVTITGVSGFGGLDRAT
jgi:hypothetical protein